MAVKLFFHDAFPVIYVLLIIYDIYSHFKCSTQRHEMITVKNERKKIKRHSLQGPKFFIRYWRIIVTLSFGIPGSNCTCV